MAYALNGTALISGPPALVAELVKILGVTVQVRLTAEVEECRNFVQRAADVQLVPGVATLDDWYEDSSSPAPSSRQSARSLVCASELRARREFIRLMPAIAKKDSDAESIGEVAEPARSLSAGQEARDGHDVDKERPPKQQQQVQLLQTGVPNDMAKNPPPEIAEREANG